MYLKDILTELINEKDEPFIVDTIDSVTIDYPSISGRGFIYLLIDFTDSLGNLKRTSVLKRSYDKKLTNKREEKISSLFNQTNL